MRELRRSAGWARNGDPPRESGCVDSPERLRRMLRRVEHASAGRRMLRPTRTFRGGVPAALGACTVENHAGCGSRLICLAPDPSYVRRERPVSAVVGCGRRSGRWESHRRPRVIASLLAARRRGRPVARIRSLARARRPRTQVEEQRGEAEAPTAGRQRRGRGVGSGSRKHWRGGGRRRGRARYEGKRRRHPRRHLLRLPRALCLLRPQDRGGPADDRGDDN